jgi:uncharacterized protein YndB with AHSA1/START domain
MPFPTGILAVRRSIHIAAPPERVWQEFTTFERMRAWFGSRHPLGDGRLGHEVTRYEPGIAGCLEFDAGYWGEKRLVFGGKTVDWDPPREVTFELEWYGQGWLAPEHLTFRLTPALGGTVVELIVHGLERTGPTAPDDLLGAESGWTTAQLQALRRIVTG